MTTDTIIEDTPIEATAWDKGVQALDPNNPPPEPEAAPSTEGVVTSETPEPEAPKPKINLGGLSTKDLIAFTLDPDVDPADKERALRLRSARIEKSPQAADRQNRIEQLQKEHAIIDAADNRRRQDYPEIQEIEQPRSDLERAKITREIQAEKQRIADEEFKSAYAYLDDKYPDFVGVRDSPGFREWFAAQPQSVQQDTNRGGVVGAERTLAAYENHVLNQGTRSPFMSSQEPPAPSAADAVRAETARLIERRATALKNSAVIPSGARSAQPTPESDAASAWNAGVALVNQSRRN